MQLVKLTRSQFVIGDSLDACREALHAEKPDPRMHLLERLNIDFLAQNSIVPAARSIAKVKVSGRLPSLHVNFSDSKYKTLMRLIDVALPRLEDDESKASGVTQRISGQRFQPGAGLFKSGEDEYIVDDNESIKGKEDELYEDALQAVKQVSTDNTLQKSVLIPLFLQHQFELSFEVDSLRATMLRSVDDGSEKMLGDLNLSHFALNIRMAKFEMKVDVGLRAINVTSSPPDLKPVQLISTESDADTNVDLMQVAYRRVQKASPDFLTKYDGYNQSVDVDLSTFNFRAVPEHVLALYDYIMSTFVPSKNGSASQAEDKSSVIEPAPSGETQPEPAEDKIRVRAKLASFQGWGFS